MLLIYKDEILRKLAQEYTKRDPNLIAIVLFGSVSRGDYKPNSDIDVILVTRNVKSTRKLFSEFSYDILLKTNVIVTAIYMTEKDYKNLRTPLTMKVKKEGRILWKKQEM